MVTGAFGVTIGCNQRSSGRLMSAGKRHWDGKVRSSPGGGLPGQPTSLTCIQNISVKTFEIYEKVIIATCSSSSRESGSKKYD
jgi:hypothetical protein